jgi:hypothetical protein
MADALLLPRRFLAPSTAAASSSASSSPPPRWACLAAAQPRPRRFAGLKVRAFFLILSWEWRWKGRGFVFPCPLVGLPRLGNLGCSWFLKVGCSRISVVNEVTYAWTSCIMYNPCDSMSPRRTPFICTRKILGKPQGLFCSFGVSVIFLGLSISEIGVICVFTATFLSTLVLIWECLVFLYSVSFLMPFHDER